MRQLGIGLQNHLSRLDRWPAPPWTVSLLGDVGLSAMESTSLSPEILGREIVPVYLCPADDLLRLSPLNLVVGNISLNARLTGQPASVARRGSSNLIACVERRAQDLNVCWAFGSEALTVAADSPHRLGLNAAFGDGHAAFITLDMPSTSVLDSLLLPDQEP